MTDGGSYPPSVFYVHGSYATGGDYRGIGERRAAIMFTDAWGALAEPKTWRAVLCLASDDSSFVTGHLLLVDESNTA